MSAPCALPPFCADAAQLLEALHAGLLPASLVLHQVEQAAQPMEVCCQPSGGRKGESAELPMEMAGPVEVAAQPVEVEAQPAELGQKLPMMSPFGLASGADSFGSSIDQAGEEAAAAAGGGVPMAPPAPAVIQRRASVTPKRPQDTPFTLFGQGAA